VCATDVEACIGPTPTDCLQGQTSAQERPTPEWKGTKGAQELSPAATKGQVRVVEGTHFHTLS
jgi:hypothetical protein